MRGMAAYTSLALGIVIAFCNPPSQVFSAEYLSLGCSEMKTNEGSDAPGLLVRECVRQAVLIAGRDELGLSTRDVTLRENLAHQDGKDHLIDPRISATGGIHVVLKHRAGETDKVRFEQRFLILGWGKPQELVSFAKLMEKHSREQFVAALKQSGFEGRPNPIDPAVRVPGDVQLQLREMNFLSQFAAVRSLHAIQRNEGESPATLAALARGYANLGYLTAFHWNAAHKAFFARSLLYAQRLAAREQDSAWSLWHRAYALALCGAHQAALDDLAAAADAASKADDQPVRPGWVPLLEALCQFKRAPLVAAMGDDEFSELAAVLAYTVVERCGIEALTLRAGRESLQRVPECYQICDSMNRYRGVINRHQTTVLGPAVLHGTLSKRFKELPNLPPEVKLLSEKQPTREAAERTDPAWIGGEQRAQLVRALVEAGAPQNDQAEPSWEVLGRMLEDVTLIHAYRRLDFFSEALGYPFSAFQDQLELARATVGEHPLRDALLCAALNPTRDQNQIQKAAKNLEFPDAVVALYPFARRTKLSTGSQDLVGDRLWSAILRQRDLVEPDLAQLALYKKDSRKYLAPLKAISPHATQTHVLEVEHAKDSSPEDLQKFETRFHDEPAPLRALATLYMMKVDFDGEERCLKRALELAPDQSGFAALAELYLRQERRDDWIATLKQSLEHDDYALSHARTRADIANYYLERKQPQEALPFAEAAAQSGAAWALMTAVNCYSALERWDEAEAAIQRCAQRYPGQQYDWYLWCARTGHGNLAEAEKFVNQYVRTLRERSADEAEKLGTYYLIAGKRKMAKDAFFGAMMTEYRPWMLINHIRLLDEERTEKNLKFRDQALNRLILFSKRNSKEAKKSAFMAPYIEWLTQTLQQPAESEPDLAKLDEIGRSPATSRSHHLLYFVGDTFAQHGQYERAREYFQKMSELPNGGAWMSALAQASLRLLDEQQAKSQQPAPADK